MSYFTSQADSYKGFRPTYPTELFEWLRAISTGGTVWDVGCGSGQASIALAAHFPHVIATDTSQAQIALAPTISNVEYRCESANRSSIGNGSIGLTLVAQALHWFDLDAFYAEVRRVSMPKAPLVALTYNLLAIDGVDEVIRHLYFDVLGPYWPSERKHVESGYREIPFPYSPIESPQFAMQAKWTLPHLIGYLKSWSALAIYENATGKDALVEIRDQLEGAWGNPTAIKVVTWPLSVLAGR